LLKDRVLDINKAPNKAPYRVIDRILKYTYDSDDFAFLTREFYAFGTSVQVHRVLNKLVQENLLIKMRQGVYARATIALCLITGVEFAIPTYSLSRIEATTHQKLSAKKTLTLTATQTSNLFGRANKGLIKPFWQTDECNS